MIRVIFYFIKPTVLQFVLPSKLVGFEAYGSRIHGFDHQEVHAVFKNGTVGKECLISINFKYPVQWI